MEGTGGLILDRHHMSTSAARNARRKYRKPDHRADEHCRPRERPLLETGRRTLPPAIRTAATGRRWECDGPSRGRDTFRIRSGNPWGAARASAPQTSSRADVECPGRDRQFLRVGGQGRHQPIQDTQHVGRAARGIAHASAVAPGALGKIPPPPRLSQAFLQAVIRPDPCSPPTRPVARLAQRAAARDLRWGSVAPARFHALRQLRQS